MTRRILTGIIATLALATPAHAAPNPVALAAQMYPNSPCNGRTTTILDPNVTSRNHYEEAPINAPGYKLDCTIHISPAFATTATPMARCIVYLHESGHLAGLNHTPTGIMSPNPIDYYEPCAGQRDRIMHALSNQPHVVWVACGRLIGRSYTCRTELQNDTIIHYRVRTRGDNYAITRARAR